MIVKHIRNLSNVACNIVNLCSYIMVGMTKTFILIALVPVLLVGGFFAFNAYLYQEKQEVSTESYEPYRASLSGEYVCLPKVGDGPHTLECTFGMKADTGEFYAVDFNLMSQEHRPLEVGERFSANGTVTPLERLSSSHWQQYDIEGIFSVTDSVQVEEEIVFCTQEVKMCSDGSYVSRQGPSCEFASCPTESPEPVACTMDAKICPDGSAVGREGPNCEFKACPGELENSETQ